MSVSNTRSRPNNPSQGFTMVELLVALAIAGIVMSAIYALFSSQSRTYAIQSQLVDLQQSLRFSMLAMEREIRKTAYNPGGLTEARAESDGIDNDCDGTADEVDDASTLFRNESEVFGFLDTRVSSVTFALDPDGDGRACGEQERVTFALSGTTLMKNGVPLSDNIEVLDFVYLAEDGGLATSIKQIRSVQIAIIGRSKEEDSSYENVHSYKNLQGVEILAAQNDGYRRRLLTSQLYIRNLKK